MSFFGYINMVIAIIGLVMMVYALKTMPPRRCAEPIVGDSLVLVVYLLMINSHYMAQQSPYASLTARAWHLFDLVVLLNIIFHIKTLSTRRNLR